MTIPTRDELIERVRAMMGGASTQKRVDFALNTQDRTVALLDAEIRRAVAEELEALREGMRSAEGGLILNRIDARLAALREQTEQPNTAPPTTEDSQRRVAPSGSGLGGALSREANLLSPNPSGGRQHASSGLAATSSAPREQESGYYANAGVTGPGSESVKVREQTEHPAPSGSKPSSPRVDAGSSTGPAQGSLSDADVLEAKRLARALLEVLM